MDVLNVASTGMYMTLALIVNFKEMHATMNVEAKISCSWAQCRYTEIAQRIFKWSDTQYISLTLDKELNSLIYRTLIYVNTYVSYKLLKTLFRLI